MAGDIEVRHCRILIAVQEFGGVGAAARALGIAQSTVSEALLSLERLIGAPVTLRRAGRETTLTAAAEALLPHARTLISVSEAALAAGTREGRSTIRLGTVESISSFLLPGPLREFRILWPQVEVRIAIGLCEDLRRRVERSDLDLAMTIERADHLRQGNLVEMYRPARLRLVVSPDHPLAGRIAARRDLATHTCLLTDHEGAFNDLLRYWIGDIAAPLRFESAGSVDGVKRGLLESDAIGVLPDYAVADELAAGSLVILDTADPLPAVALCLTTASPPRRDSPLESLIGTIRAMVPELGGLPGSPGA